MLGTQVSKVAYHFLQCKFIFNSKLAIELKLDTQSNFMQHPEQMNSS